MLPYMFAVCFFHLLFAYLQVMPFSTACSTPLSNFEAGQNYKEVDDPAGMSHGDSG